MSGRTIVDLTATSAAARAEEAEVRADIARADEAANAAMLSGLGASALSAAYEALVAAGPSQPAFAGVPRLWAAGDPFARPHTASRLEAGDATAEGVR